MDVAGCCEPQHPGCSAKFIHTKHAQKWLLPCSTLSSTIKSNKMTLNDFSKVFGFVGAPKAGASAVLITLPDLAQTVFKQPRRCAIVLPCCVSAGSVPVQ